jgi:hypothetical protein
VAQHGVLVLGADAEGDLAVVAHDPVVFARPGVLELAGGVEGDPLVVAEAEAASLLDVAREDAVGVVAAGGRAGLVVEDAGLVAEAEAGGPGVAESLLEVVEGPLAAGWGRGYVDSVVLSKREDLGKE